MPLLQLPGPRCAHLNAASARAVLSRRRRYEASAASSMAGSRPASMAVVMLLRKPSSSLLSENLSTMSMRPAQETMPYRAALEWLTHWL